MTQEELNRIIAADPYCQARKEPNANERSLFLREVGFHCPLCGKELLKRGGKGKGGYQIAHIYPNRPTIEQYENFIGLERLGDDSESFENKIALCLECHPIQDYHTTAEEYLKLKGIKERLLKESSLENATATLGLEDGIRLVVQKLSSLPDDDLAELNYLPIPIANKFLPRERLLQAKVSGYVNTFYPFIRTCFQGLDGKNGFYLEVLSGQIRGCFIKMSKETQDKEMIFTHIVKWIQTKTQSYSVEACEAVVSFFIQNCEVFYEIAK